MMICITDMVCLLTIYIGTSYYVMK